MTDARFEDGGEKPLRLSARDAEDLAVISALVQDSVFPATEMTWDRRSRRFALLLNRFRWEDGGRHGAERVQALLSIDDVLSVRSQGVTPGDAETILSLLSLTWEAGEDGMGTILLTLAGDGAIAVEAECLEVALRDVTRPYRAPSGKAPDHA